MLDPQPLVYAEKEEGAFIVVLFPNGGPGKKVRVRVPVPRPSPSSYADARALAVDEARRIHEAEWGPRVGLGYGSPKAWALPLGAQKWRVSFPQLQDGPRVVEVEAATPELAILRGWEEVRKTRQEAARRKRWN